MQVDVQIFLDANAAQGILERRGLSKVRHLDTEHLWLQQEQVCRLLPLSKLDGTLNAADLMTKYLFEKEMCKHMEMLQLELCHGRTKIAADLHHVRHRRGGDSLDQRGRKGIWRRAHQTWRRCLFTPMTVGNGLTHGEELQGRRPTGGVRRDGTRVQVSDNWKDPSRAHVQLHFEWRGHTTLSIRDLVSICEVKTATGEDHPCQN